MGQTQNFFNEKKSWSVVKDRILDYYLSPYISKILRTGKPLIIFDCFAGKGKFDDGEKGSPLIIAEHIKANLQKNAALINKIKGFFIEKKYHAALSNNLSGYPNVSALNGTFEENLKYILSVTTASNVFLYVDPYGIKSLSLNNFEQIKNKSFYSLEMLMNFNSAGFLREGCRLLKDADVFIDDELTDYEIEDDVNTIEKMDAIAGGDYWQHILNDYYNGRIDIYTAEESFFSKYSETVKKLFRYTVNIPIKIKTTHLPKYRLIFGSDHEDGLILMADNMNKKWNEIIVNQRGGQEVLFDFEFPDLTLLKGFDLRTDILSLLSKSSKGLPLKNLIVRLILRYGITFSESDYKKKIGQMEKDSEVIVERIPALTKTNGKPATAMDYRKYQITVKRRICR